MSKYSEIIIGESVSPTIFFDKYELSIVFSSGDYERLIFEPKDALPQANLWASVIGMNGEKAYELIKASGLSPEWGIEEDGYWAEVDSMTMYYYNHRGTKKHVILK